MTARRRRRAEQLETTVSEFGGFLGEEHLDNYGLVGEYDMTCEGRLPPSWPVVRHDWNNRFADVTTYRVQASYKLDEGTRFHAAAGSWIKDPSFSDLFDFFAGRFLGNPNLQPEKSEGWEAGLDQTLPERPGQRRGDPFRQPAARHHHFELRRPASRRRSTCRALRRSAGSSCSPTAS